MFVVRPFVAVLGALALVFADAQARPAPVDPVRTVLIDQAGRSFSFAQLQGAPVAVTFVATRCTDACPLIDAWFAKLQARVRKQRIDATLLTITLDPAYDTPRVMAREARALGADPAVWRFATGSVASVDAILGAFRVHPERDEHGIPDIHTTFIYVLSGRGKIAAIAPASPRSPDEVAQALRKAASRP